VKADLAELARAVSKLTGLPDVEPSGQADLTETLDRAAAHGAVENIVQPYFLGMVGALALRLRERLRCWEHAHVGLRVSLGEPLGDHPLVTAAIRDTALRCLSGRKGALVLVGHGSPDPAWSRSLHAQVSRLERLRLFERVIAAFLAHEGPGVEETLQGLRGEVAVVPFFLSRGFHTSVELPQLLDGARRPRCRLHLAPFWADDTRIALAVAERIGTTWSRTNRARPGLVRPPPAWYQRSMERG
jgi:sirohydrochlorin ferrochelatase